LKKRFLIKLSGESLKGALQYGISYPDVDKLCYRLANIIKKGVDLGFVIGGGNIFRGASCEIEGYDRITGDNIGMLATAINSLTISERLRHYGVKCIVQSAIKIEGIAELFNRDKVEEVFKENGAVVFCGGTGNPFVSTDTAAVIKSLQINANAIFKATKVDGIYDKDPFKFADAKKYDTITYDEIIRKNIEVMDLTAMLMLKKNKMKLMVFNMNDDSLERACTGETVGTLVTIE